MLLKVNEAWRVLGKNIRLREVQIYRSVNGLQEISQFLVTTDTPLFERNIMIMRVIIHSSLTQQKLAQ